MNPANECLHDVVSHHHDFRQALVLRRNRTQTVDSQSYWQHQIDVLDRMKDQAQAALTQQKEGAGNHFLDQSDTERLLYVARVLRSVKKNEAILSSDIWSEVVVALGAVRRVLNIESEEFRKLTMDQKDDTQQTPGSASAD
jgi:hypothetical protein